METSRRPIKTGVFLFYTIERKIITMERTCNIRIKLLLLRHNRTLTFVIVLLWRDEVVRENRFIGGSRERARSDFAFIKRNADLRATLCAYAQNTPPPTFHIKHPLQCHFINFFSKSVDFFVKMIIIDIAKLTK